MNKTLYSAKDSCGKPHLPGKYTENWGLSDPTGKSDDVFIKTIQTIENHVLRLKEMLADS